jgi:hypothetical protein
MTIPVTMVIPVRVSMAIVIVPVALGITIVAITVVITASITVATDRNAPSQRQTNQKQNPKKNKLFIHIITPFLCLYLFRRVRGEFIHPKEDKETVRSELATG